MWYQIFWRFLVFGVVLALISACAPKQSEVETNQISRRLVESWRQNRQMQYPPPYYYGGRPGYVSPYFPRYPQYPVYDPEMDNPYYTNPGVYPNYPYYDPSMDGGRYPYGTNGNQAYPLDNDSEYYFPKKPRERAEDYPLFFD